MKEIKDNIEISMKLAGIEAYVGYKVTEFAEKFGENLTKEMEKSEKSNKEKTK